MLKTLLCVMARLVFLCYNNINPPIGGGVSAAVSGFGAADAFGAVFFDALRGGINVERSARADDVRVWRPSEEYAAFGQVSDLSRLESASRGGLYRKHLAKP